MSNFFYNFLWFLPTILIGAIIFGIITGIPVFVGNLIGGVTGALVGAGCFIFFLAVGFAMLKTLMDS